MDHLIARVRDRKNCYRKLLSDRKVFSVTIGETVPYSSATVPEEEQWYVIGQFSEKNYCIDLLRNSWDSTSYEQLNKKEIDKMDYLCAYQDGNEYYFQRIYKSTLIRGKGLISIGDTVKMEEKGNVIVVNEIPDAVYYKDSDCLYFRKLETIAPIFKGIDELYREATDAEVEKFIDSPFIYLDATYTIEKIGKANRRRIAMALDTLGKLDEAQKKDLFTYTDQYYPGLQYDGRTFKIKDEDDLKNLLYGIEQRFYTTPVTREKRVANSVIAIG